MPSRDGFIIMPQQERINMNARHSQRGGYWDAYVWINDADSLFEELKANGAIIEYEPCIREYYDMKEFAVRDSDGHIIAFGQDYEV